MSAKNRLPLTPGRNMMARTLRNSKVVAGLLGLGLDEIVRRAERARRRRVAAAKPSSIAALGKYGFGVVQSAASAVSQTTLKSIDASREAEGENA
jgi:hypothetical protein